MKHNVLLLAFLPLLGCTSNPKHYTVALDDASESDNNRGQVEFAAKTWVDAVNDPEQLTIDVAPPHTACSDDMVCVHIIHHDMPGAGVDGHTACGNTVVHHHDYIGSNTYTVDVYIDDAYGDGFTMQHNIQHEFGHAMELLHTGPDTVMYAYIDPSSVQSTAAQSVTCSDVEQYVSLRGMKSHCKE